MNDSIIYERHYPETELENPGDSENQIELANSAEHVNFEQIMEEIYKDVVYVPLLEKQAAAKEFVEAAIDISNAYQLDVKICCHFDRIEVKYYFDCATSVGFLKDIIACADDISIFKDTEGFNLGLSIDFYTRAVYRKDRRIIP